MIVWLRTSACPTAEAEAPSAANTSDSPITNASDRPTMWARVAVSCGSLDLLDGQAGHVAEVGRQQRQHAR